MPIPSAFVSTARIGWKWQWNQLMKGLAPADEAGNYIRQTSQCQQAVLPKESELLNRPKEKNPHLIIGRSCPWAHRTWLVHQLRGLDESLNLLIANADHKAGRWKIYPKWIGCNSLQEIYQKCRIPLTHRATVPAIVDPIVENYPKLIGNESAQLVELLNQWPTNKSTLDLEPNGLKGEIDNWQELLQNSVNDGVYRCGFARNQSAYKQACNEMFEALKLVDHSLQKRRPWLCGESLTLADIRLFPTLIRWEIIYSPLFRCSKDPLWIFPNLWEWRQRFFALPKVAETCNPQAWLEDYFGALFPLNPSNIVPLCPDLVKMINVRAPN